MDGGGPKPKLCALFGYVFEREYGYRGSALYPQSSGFAGVFRSFIRGTSIIFANNTTTHRTCHRPPSSCVARTGVRPSGLCGERMVLVSEAGGRGGGRSAKHDGRLAGRRGVHASELGMGISHAWGRGQEGKGVSPARVRRCEGGGAHTRATHAGLLRAYKRSLAQQWGGRGRGRESRPHTAPHEGARKGLAGVRPDARELPRPRVARQGRTLWRLLYSGAAKPNARAAAASGAAASRGVLSSRRGRRHLATRRTRQAPFYEVASQSTESVSRVPSGRSNVILTAFGS